MTTYKLVTAEKAEPRDYSQILFAKSESKPKDGRNWIEGDSDIFDIELEYQFNAKHLFTENGVKYYGWF